MVFLMYFNSSQASIENLYIYCMPKRIVACVQAQKGTPLNIKRRVVSLIAH